MCSKGSRNKDTGKMNFVWGVSEGGKRHKFAEDILVSCHACFGKRCWNTVCCWLPSTHSLSFLWEAPRWPQKWSCLTSALSTPHCLPLVPVTRSSKSEWTLALKGFRIFPWPLSARVGISFENEMLRSATALSGKLWTLSGATIQIQMRGSLKSAGPTRGSL